MNESILKALMKLFAIVANVTEEGRARNERDVVYEYLNRQFSNELVNRYMDYFDKNILHYHPDLRNGSEVDIEKQQSHNTRRLDELCDQLNEELHMEQKIIILVYLLDFINRGEDLTRNELDFVAATADNLNIKSEEFSDIRFFTFGRREEIVKKENLLIIDGDGGQLPKGIKHLYVEKFEGHIEVLRISSTSTYVFRYYGDENLLLNGHLLKPCRSYIWSPGSVIKNPRFGSIYYIWVAGKFIQETSKSKIVFTARDIEYSYGGSNNGLKPFTMTEESGRLIGIIGGSGSGKSTLLKVLNGNLKPKRGKIEINGFDIHTNKDELKGVIGYVPQEDFLLKQLTVYQNLYYNARLCFGHYSEEQLQQVVEQALRDFDLVEAKDLKVGDTRRTFLSGGQRKRLNIALEMMREPSILFADEPTSGLSSMDSEKVMTLLKRQALKGKLVISILHQPSSDNFKLLDKLLVIDQGGYVIFYGNPLDAIGYFKRINNFVDAEESECLTCGNVNPDQILRNVELRVVDVNGRLSRKRKTAPEEWYRIYREHRDPQVRKVHRPYKKEIPESDLDIPGRIKQLVVFFTRDLLSKLANKQYLLVTLLEAPALAFILAFFSRSSRSFYSPGEGYVYSGNMNIPAYLFMIVIVALFLGLVVSAEEIFKDRKILNREKFLNLSRGSYLSSKIALMFIISAIQAITFVMIGNSILEIRGMVMHYFILFFTTACWANLMGLIISSGFNSVITIYILIPLILVPKLLFSGVVIDFNNINQFLRSSKNVPFIGNIITSRWAYEAIAVGQFKKNRFEKHFFDTEQRASEAIYKRTYLIPELRRLLSEEMMDNGENSDKGDAYNEGLILQNELFKLNMEYPYRGDVFDPVAGFDSLPESVSEDISIYLSKAADHYHRQYINAIDERENIYNQLVNRYGSKEKFLNFKERYYNNQLASALLNEKEVLEHAIYNNEIIRLKEPVFQLPDSKTGRAHFYAPEKRIGNYFIDTFWYNMLIIWIYTGILAVILYSDFLKRIINYIEKMRLNRLNKRIIKILNRE